MYSLTDLKSVLAIIFAVAAVMTTRFENRRSQTTATVYSKRTKADSCRSAKDVFAEHLAILNVVMLSPDCSTERLVSKPQITGGHPVSVFISPRGRAYFLCLFISIIGLIGLLGRLYS